MAQSLIDYGYSQPKEAPRNAHGDSETDILYLTSVTEDTEVPLFVAQDVRAMKIVTTLQVDGVSKSLIFALVMFAAHASAQVLPDAPSRHIDRTEWALLATDATVRGLDVYSTYRMQSAGNKEGTLPGWIANHPPVMALYSGGIVYGQYWVARKLSAHGHRKLAHVVTTADITITAPFAIHNLFLPTCTAPNIYTVHGCQAP